MSLLTMEKNHREA